MESSVDEYGGREARRLCVRDARRGKVHASVARELLRHGLADRNLFPVLIVPRECDTPRATSSDQFEPNRLRALQSVAATTISDELLGEEARATDVAQFLSDVGWPVLDLPPREAAKAADELRRKVLQHIRQLELIARPLLHGWESVLFYRVLAEVRDGGDPLDARWIVSICLLLDFLSTTADFLPDELGEHPRIEEHTAADAGCTDSESRCPRRRASRRSGIPFQGRPPRFAQSVRDDVPLPRARLCRAWVLSS